MFRITRDPSSGSFIQCLAKIKVMVLSCLLTWTQSVLWHHIYPWCVCVLHSVERHCVCVYTAQCREALCVYCIVQRGTVCTAQCREVLCVYCTVQRGTVCILHSVERHCVCTVQCREALQTVQYTHVPRQRTQQNHYCNFSQALYKPP